jgi:hypothetical protein
MHVAGGSARHLSPSAFPCGIGCAWLKRSTAPVVTALAGAPIHGCLGARRWRSAVAGFAPSLAASSSRRSLCVAW